MLPVTCMSMWSPALSSVSSVVLMAAMPLPSTSADSVPAHTAHGVCQGACVGVLILASQARKFCLARCAQLYGELLNYGELLISILPKAHTSSNNCCRAGLQAKYGSPSSAATLAATASCEGLLLQRVYLTAS